MRKLLAASTSTWAIPSLVAADIASTFQFTPVAGGKQRTRLKKTQNLLAAAMKVGREI